MNFLQAKTIHFTGIKGVGMAALAGIALDLKKTVSGSDTAEVFPTDVWLKTTKAAIKVGFSPKHLSADCELLIYTGAHRGAANPEVRAARRRGITVINYAQALAQLAEEKMLLATAGVGGKSTTAGMLATILETAGCQPSWAIGVGALRPLGQPGRWRRGGGYLVAETDEFVADPKYDLTPKFHYLHPAVAIVTNLEHDHPDIYPTLEEVFASFRVFVNQLRPGGTVIANIDNPRVQTWIRTIDQPVLTYGFSPQADWRILAVRTVGEKQWFSLQYKHEIEENLVLNLPGRYNVSNAAAALAAGYFLGLESEKLAAGIKAFGGSRRRFELIAEVNKVRLYDDYAHHPLEIKAVLAAARDWLPGRRLIVIFQSHTYSRTKALLKEFGESLSAADVVIVNDIFASARETETLGVSGAALARLIKPKKKMVNYAAGLTETIRYLEKIIVAGDVIFTLGAGNNWLWHQSIIECLQRL
jgi:UDP-N-acetylmuramate--alanine ligase